jgi:hypothetical protein
LIPLRIGRGPLNLGLTVQLSQAFSLGVLYSFQNYPKRNRDNKNPVDPSLPSGREVVRLFLEESLVIMHSWVRLSLKRTKIFTFAIVP